MISESEIEAADAASRLEKILLEAIHSGNEGVKEFAKKHIYKWYLGECSDSYGIVNPNPEIVKEFELVKKTVDLESHAFGGINDNND